MAHHDESHLRMLRSPGADHHQLQLFALPAALHQLADLRLPPLHPPGQLALLAESEVQA